MRAKLSRRYRAPCATTFEGSLPKVLEGIPDLNARIYDTASGKDEFDAHLSAMGLNTGRFFGAPPTGQRYEVDMFDYARPKDGTLVEPVRQPDSLFRLEQMCGRPPRKQRPGASAVLPAAALLALRAGHLCVDVRLIDPNSPERRSAAIRARARDALTDALKRHNIVQNISFYDAS